jgi:hypothetical protein
MDGAKERQATVASGHLHIAQFGAPPLKNLNTVNAVLLKAELARRAILPASAVALPDAIENWTDGMLLAALAVRCFEPNAAHLRDDLGALGIGGRFVCGNAEWIVTDIGTRTLTAVKLDEKAVADPSWIEGPPYALAEVCFDEEDLTAIELV